jgi:hypothetical protein
MFVSSQTIDNLALLDVAAVNAALTGAFDDRIKELRGLLQQVAAQDAKVKTLADAEKVKAEAERLLADAQAADTAASDKAKSVAAREAALASAEAALNSGNANLNNAVAALEADKKAFSAAKVADWDAIGNAQKALADAQAKL